MLLHIIRSAEVKEDSSSLVRDELTVYVDGELRKIRTFFPAQDKPTHGLVTSDSFLEGFLTNQDIIMQKQRERIAFLEKEVERLYPLTKEE